MSRSIRHPQNVPPVATFRYPRGPRPPEPHHPAAPDADRSQCELCRAHQSPADLFSQVFEQDHVFLCRACFDETADRPLDTVCALSLRIAREAALARPTHPGFPLELALVVTTARARQVLTPSDVTTALTRHAHGEWGLLPAMVAAENEFALTDGRPLVSRYESSAGERFWLVTDATRIFTTVLLEGEYFRD
jgi:hypothetical protein